jgi:hypothetical protein
MEERKTNPNRRGSDFFNGISCGAAQLLAIAAELEGQQAQADDRQAVCDVLADQERADA